MGYFEFLDGSRIVCFPLNIPRLYYNSVILKQSYMFHIYDFESRKQKN